MRLGLCTIANGLHASMQAGSYGGPARCTKTAGGGFNSFTDAVAIVPAMVAVMVEVMMAMAAAVAAAARIVQVR